MKDPIPEETYTISFPTEGEFSYSVKINDKFTYIPTPFVFMDRFNKVGGYRLVIKEKLVKTGKSFLSLTKEKSYFELYKVMEVDGISYISENKLESLELSGDHLDIMKRYKYI
ncbi:MAG: hypothetical protein M0R77_00140 [Gammaproteobacteria bacterium]|nr:hypothetical protein [Acholeplasmataceae bacterium]MCK9528963.1 hypothetical protein [Gammaproteobacteria bacterium]